MWTSSADLSAKASELSRFEFIHSRFHRKLLSLGRHSWYVKLPAKCRTFLCSATLCHMCQFSFFGLWISLYILRDESPHSTNSAAFFSSWTFPSEKRSVSTKAEIWTEMMDIRYKRPQLVSGACLVSYHIFCRQPCKEVYRAVNAEPLPVKLWRILRL